MRGRQVRVGGRPVYGARQSYSRPKKSRAMAKPKMSPLQIRLIILGVVVVVLTYGIWHAFGITYETVLNVMPGDKSFAEADKLVHSSIGQGNELTIDTGALASKLQQVDPRLKDVNVVRHWPHGLIITVQLKQPSLAWSSDGQDYVLDKDGTAIGQLAAGSKLPVVTDDSNLPVTLGSVVAPSEFVAYVTELVPELKANGVAVANIDIKDTTFDLYVTTGAGYQLIFDTTRTVASEIVDYKTVMQTLAKQHQTPSKYIDLRIQGRAYWQ